MREKTPRVAILLALYEPNLGWLGELFDSLNAQTYPNLYLYIRDDGSDSARFDAALALARQRITAFPFTAARNERNLGSNECFARLTAEAEGEWFAYCDQDDVWQPEKIETLAALAEARGALMAYSDMAVIDSAGREVAASLKDLRPRLRYVEGAGLGETFFFRNCTAGCCMLIRADIAKRALPFPRGTLHDHWLAICAAASGPVAFSAEKLTRYRQHGGNQTGVLAGVNNKADYRRLRVEPLRERLACYRERFKPSAALEAFVAARLSGKALTVWKYRALSPWEAKLELVLKLLPEPVFKRMMQFLQGQGKKHDKG